MSREFKYYIDSGTDALRKMDNYRETARQVKDVVDGFWSDARVYVFGSVLEGKHTAMSDIDILIVVDGVSREEATRVKAQVYMTVEAPLEIHVASSQEFQNWYMRFIDKIEEIN